MPTQLYILLTSLFIGIVTAALVLLFRRLGKSSSLLALFLFVCSLYSGILAIPSYFDNWTDDAVLRLSLCLLLAAAPLGAMVSFTIGREGYSRYLRAKRVSILLTLLAALACILWIQVFFVPGSVPLPPDSHLPSGETLLGHCGYFSALYLVLVSIIVLTSLEQTLRSAQEHVRWEIKFLLLGLAGAFASIIYIASKVLLSGPKHGLVSIQSMEIFPTVFLASCLLILMSWKRSTGRWKVAVSPGFVYSSITLVGVGVYLIVASIVAKLAGEKSIKAFSSEPAVFLILLLALAVILLWTDLRHRVRNWIRRHLLAGNYDYRRYWLEASERVRSIDSPEVAGEALADIVQRAIGAIDVSVWLRLQKPPRLKLVGMRGDVSFAPAEEAAGIFESLIDLGKPTPTGLLGDVASGEPMAGFLQKTNASVIVPLQSGNRLVGLLTAGPDRSGQAYDWDALEFLGVLGQHVAGEFHKTDLLSTLVEAKENEAFHAFSTFLLHDLKNYASTLSLIARNASKYKEDLNFQRDAFQSVSETAEKMKKLCNSLRAFSGAAADKKPNNLNQIVQTVADNFSGVSEKRLQLCLGEIPSVLADRGEIESVVRNLVLNAREAISAGGSITVRTCVLDGQVELAVEDDGCGIKAEFVEKSLFVPFRTTKSEGLGVGLYQTRKIMEAHNGTIQVESVEGKGTTVRLRFPVIQGDAT